MERIDSSRIDVAALDMRDAVDLALLIEDEAIGRYGSLSGLVGGRYRGDADEIFRTMATMVANQRALLAARRKSLFGDAPSRLDETLISDLEAPEHGAVRVFMGPGEALEVALAATTRAFEFYEEAARAARDPAARAFLATQRDEEIDRCRALQDWLRVVPPGPDLEEAEADPPGSDAG